MIWRLLVTKGAKKQLAKLPNREQVRIERALDALQADPFSGDIKRLQPLPGVAVLVITAFFMISILTKRLSW